MLALRIAPLLLLAGCAGASNTAPEPSSPAASDTTVVRMMHDLGIGSGFGFDLPGLGFAYRATEAGLVVTALADDGPAPGAGLLEDDVVTSIAGHPLTGLSPAAIDERIVYESNAGVPVDLGVRRGGRSLRLTITPQPYSRAALRGKVRARAEVPSSGEPLAMPGPDDTVEAHVAFLLSHARNGFEALRGEEEEIAEGSSDDVLQAWISPYVVFGERKGFPPSVTRLQNETGVQTIYTSLLDRGREQPILERTQSLTEAVGNVLSDWSYATFPVRGGYVVHHVWRECFRNEGRILRITVERTLTNHNLSVDSELNPGTLCRPDGFPAPPASGDS